MDPNGVHFSLQRMMDEVKYNSYTKLRTRIIWRHYGIFRVKL